MSTEATTRRVEKDELVRVSEASCLVCRRAVGFRTMSFGYTQNAGFRENVSGEEIDS